MNIFVGSIEIQMLMWSVVLGVAQLVLATILAAKDWGMAYTLSPRDVPAPAVAKLTGRLLRGFQNFKETFVFFVVAVLVVALMARQSPMSATGAQLYFWSRLAYVPIYAAGILGVRTMLWALSMVGIAMVFLAAVA
jgi:uncharacterized MAPEG superfamily protein